MSGDKQLNLDIKPVQEMLHNLNLW